MVYEETPSGPLSIGTQLLHVGKKKKKKKKKKKERKKEETEIKIGRGRHTLLCSSC